MNRQFYPNEYIRAFDFKIHHQRSHKAPDCVFEGDLLWIFMTYLINGWILVDRAREKLKAPCVQH